MKNFQMMACEKNIYWPEEFSASEGLEIVGNLRVGNFSGVLGFEILSNSGMGKFQELDDEQFS